MISFNGSQDHIRWLEADIGAFREIISLTQLLLATGWSPFTHKALHRWGRILPQPKQLALNALSCKDGAKSSWRAIRQRRWLR